MKRRKKGNTNMFWFSIQLGFFAGLIWGLVRWFFYWFRFTSVSPGFMLKPFYRASFWQSIAGHAAGTLLFILLSILATLIYTLLFRKLLGPWPGIVYGMLWWAILFVFAGPAAGMVNRVTHSNWNTIISEFCVFVLWGLFIGYTTAFEFNDERVREPREARN
ncbi:MULTISPECIES: YqhR family membrane protein [unclassified Paenibacillus]|uniref:YqhR family membrane protein n=1 Tax=unclassified Paenibacillus TaxID=185978 RepID=UPI001C109895|nr:MULTISPECIES: YqhR family membrane protein [unclassified Paenibacillus]MBU5443045.1 hypothetical protein [Paenibacillus sp. MSJ-34]CAH0118582.1 hypothetical protein PAE9249_01071 [Paenibacillus sp. CECT 9249]